MPLDPSIPLSVQPQPFNNPFAVLAQIRAQQGTQAETQQRMQLQQQEILDNQALVRERDQKTQQAAQEQARRIAGQTALAATIRSNSTMDPWSGETVTNDKAIANDLSQQGFPELAESWLKTASGNAENLDKLNASKRSHLGTQLDYVDGLANTATNYDDFLTSLGQAAAHGMVDEGTARQLATEATKAGPDGWKTFAARVHQLSPAAQAASRALDAERNKPVVLKPGETQFAGGQPTGASVPAEPKPITEAELDAEAQGLMTKANMGQPLSPLEQAKLKAYSTRKTVVTDAAALAASGRQADAQEHSNTIQENAQKFATKQAGRKELTEKVEQPYQTAMASAQTLRDTVAAAKSGNKVGAALQSLETTMAAIRAQGLNRINTAEIGVTGNAGSMWDRIQGWFGKASEGQPVPPEIQKDMTEFAGILEKSARSKYEQGFTSTTKRYGLTDEKILPPPPSSSAASVLMTAPNGKKYNVPAEKVPAAKAQGWQ